MRTSPYSEDLRKKVINYLNKGKSQKEASEVFGIHKNTVFRWNVRYITEGSYSARVRLGRKSNIDHKAIELFVIENPDKTLSEIGKEFLISGWHVSRILKKLGFSYKKKPSHTWKLVKKSEMRIKKQ